MESQTTILLVDNYEPVRRVFRLILEERAEYKIIGETGDGRTAVDMARELTPTIILMDVFLPGLNGFDAASEILKELPEARILFVSENRQCTSAREAFRIGGCGYLVKSYAARELLVAVRSILDGHPYISRGLDC